MPIVQIKSLGFGIHPCSVHSTHPLLWKMTWVTAVKHLQTIYCAAVNYSENREVQCTWNWVKLHPSRVAITCVPSETIGKSTNLWRRKVQCAAQQECLQTVQSDCVWFSRWDSYWIVVSSEGIWIVWVGVIVSSVLSSHPTTRTSLISSTEFISKFIVLPKCVDTA